MAIQDINFPPSTINAQERVYQLGKAFTLQYGVAAIRAAFFPPANEPDNKIGGDDSRSFLGTIVASNLSIAANSYKTGNGQNVSFPDLNFDAVLFEVSNTKNIVYTPIQGKDGTVKEYIGGGDYDISCKGIITGLNGQYPDKYNGAQSRKPGDTINVVDNLINALNCNTEIEVNSWYLKQLGIYSIVITRAELWQEEGNYSMQRFSFNAKSDIPFVVNLNA